MEESETEQHVYKFGYSTSSDRCKKYKVVLTGSQKQKKLYCSSFSEEYYDDCLVNVTIIHDFKECIEKCRENDKCTRKFVELEEKYENKE